jgi:hypothetical protein
MILSFYFWQRAFVFHAGSFASHSRPNGVKPGGFVRFVFHGITLQTNNHSKNVQTPKSLL